MAISKLTSSEISAVSGGDGCFYLEEEVTPTLNTVVGGLGAVALVIGGIIHCIAKCDNDNESTFEISAKIITISSAVVSLVFNFWSIVESAYNMGSLDEGCCK